jgi:hypothetical protein
MTSRRLRIQRLARREEKAILKRVTVLSVVSLVLTVLLFTIGISLLGKFADLLSLVFKDKEDNPGQVTSLLAPILDELPEATNGAKLNVHGFVSDGEKVEIYLSGEKVGEAEIEENRFEFEDVSLKEGENQISAKTISGDRNSESSKTVIVIFDQEEPKLEIEIPTEGQNFVGNNRVNVRGKTDKDAQVYANGFLASVDFEGNFEVFVPVSEGETSIEIKAIDSAGNTKTETRKVNFRK